MPIYEYKCQNCHRTLEKRQKFSDPELTVCPTCEGRLEKMISAPSFQFAGGGWYADGYGNKSAAKSSEGGGSTTASTGDSGGGSSSESTSSAPASAPAAPASAPAASTPSSPAPAKYGQTPRLQNKAAKVAKGFLAALMFCVFV